MRRRSVKCLLFGWLFLTSLLTSAQNKNQKQGCEDNCFSTEILSVEELASGCLSYTLQVNADGSCAHALSHYSVAIPGCAQVSSVSNSEGWKIEYGMDPTSGISGFKVDDISGFGENGNAGNFTVTFTICENGCDEALSCWAPQVAYKAATCVFYEDTEVTCVKLDAGLNIVDATCADDANGSIGVSIIEGTEPITYAWSNGTTNQTIENAMAGVYTVTITDATGETMELSGEVKAPAPINISTNITDASCQGQSDGAVITTVEGGVAPYTYSWSNGATTENLEGVSGGYYVLTVTDTNGCEAKATAIVENTVFIDINGIITNSGCSVNNGAVDVTVEGGEAPYTYSWSNGSDSEDLSGLAAGSYRLTATDANGCLSSRTFIVRENNPISLSATMQQTACVENNSGAIDLTINGGEEPYSYSWLSGETTEDIGNLAAGRYTVSVTDASGCSATLSIDVTAATFQANSIVSQISCNGANDGEIELMTTGGTAPFTFEWSNGENTEKITGLSPGQYSVLITDAAGCTKSLAYYLPDATPISATYNVSNPNCLTDGFEVAVSVSGGKAPYTYNWSDGSSLQNLSAAIEGIYSLVITDINGCTNTLDVTVDYTSTECDDPNDGDDDSDDDGSDDSGDGDDDSGDQDDGDDNPDDGGDNPDDGGDNPDDGDDSDDGDDDSDDGGDDSDDGSDDDDCYNPFSSEISLVEVNGSCYTYQAVVTYDGQHVRGLSHMSVGIDCGTVDEVSNSENWKIEYGKDPTTGIEGFKIDDINGFGEGQMEQYFEYSFTVCSDKDQCMDRLATADFEVSYKYGQCVSYELVDGEADMSGEMTINAYPNPFTETATLEFYTPVSSKLKAELYNRNGIKVKDLYNGELRANESIKLSIDGYNLPADIYNYKVTTDYGVKYGKIVLTN